MSAIPPDDRRPPTTGGPDGRAEDRADDLLPEERLAGTEDPQAQAAAILADSDERAAARDGDQDGGAVGFEQRSSDETVEP